MNLPWSRHSFVNRKTHACSLLQYEVVKPESRLYNLDRSATRQKESAWRLQKISSKEKLHLRSYDRAKLFSISGTLQLDTPVPTSHTMPSLWVFFASNIRLLSVASSVANFCNCLFIAKREREDKFELEGILTRPSALARSIRPSCKCPIA